MSVSGGWGFCLFGWFFVSIFFLLGWFGYFYNSITAIKNSSHLEILEVFLTIHM